MPLDERSFKKMWKSTRFLQLFVFLLFAFLMQAIFHHSFFVLLLISFLYLHIIYVAFLVDGAKNRLPYWLLGLWAAIFVGRHIFHDVHPLVFVISEFLSIVLLVISIKHIFHYTLFSKKITTDILFASIVNYLLISLLFARVYAVVDFYLPGSFSYPGKVVGVGESLLSGHFSYFSLVTIATLGYGDIVPLHPLAQTLAAIEAVLGQFYVAMVVAWLVSMHVLHNSNNRT